MKDRGIQYLRKLDGEYSFEACLGHDIFSAVKTAIAIAKKDNVKVKLFFNGSEFAIHGNSEANELIAEYFLVREAGLSRVIGPYASRGAILAGLVKSAENAVEQEITAISESLRALNVRKRFLEARRAELSQSQTADKEVVDHA